MPGRVFQIRPFNLQGALPAEYAALNRYTNRIRLERLPDDPPISVEETTQNLQSIPSFVELKLWAAWSAGGDEILAQGNVGFLLTEENQHLAQFDVTVLPEYRRQGMGRQFLALIAAAAQQENRRLLIANTVDRIPGGEAFMARMGAQQGLVAHTNQLRIADLNLSLLADWLVQGQRHLAEFELGFWNGAYPEDNLQQVADLYELVNQQPLGDLEIEDEHTTPARLRQMENNLFATGNQRWTFYLVQRATGQFAGYTEASWHPNRPQLLMQMMTGVFPQFRSQGLGRWLKAAMFDKVLREHPQVTFVRTTNADSNAAMLKINTELGFKPYFASAFWQVELARVLSYLQSSRSNQ